MISQNLDYCFCFAWHILKDKKVIAISKNLKSTTEICKIRKPLIVFTPKSLLRNKLAVSDIKEFAIKDSRQDIFSGWVMRGHYGGKF